MAGKLKALPDELQLATAAHVKYVQSLDTMRDQYEYWLTEHLRLSGLYWGLVSLHLLGHPEALPRSETIDFVLSCQHDNGGFGAAPGHDAHMLYTVSAVQILAMIDALDELDRRGKGKTLVGKCKSLTDTTRRQSIPDQNITKSSPTCRIERPVHSRATNGAKRTPGFSTAPSTPCPCSAFYPLSTLTKPWTTSLPAPTSTAATASGPVRNHTPARSSRAWRPSP